MDYKEAFTSFVDFGYKNVQPSDNTSEYVNQVIEHQLTPLQKIAEKHNIRHSKIPKNKGELDTKMQEYNNLLQILKEEDESKDVTIDIGSQSGTNIKTITYDDIDTSYQHLSISKTITKDNVPLDIGDDVYSVNVVGRTIKVEKISGNAVGWDYDLKINGRIFSTKDKKYHHKGTDAEFMDKRKTHQDKFIQDTREVLLYNNHMFIAGTITTAIALILVYRMSS